MAGNIDDFIKQFTGGGGVDFNQVGQFFERFVSTKPQDQAFDNDALHQGATEYLSKLPDAQFLQTAKDSFTQLPPQKQQALVASLLAALTGHGVDLETLTSDLAIQSTDPRQMSADDYAKLANFARHEHPDAMQQVVAEKPGWIKAMGSPVVMGVLGMIASKMMGNRVQSH